MIKEAIQDQIQIVATEAAIKAAMEEKALGDAFEIAQRYMTGNTCVEGAGKCAGALWQFLVAISMAHGLKYEMAGPRKAIIGERIRNENS